MLFGFVKSSGKAKILVLFVIAAAMAAFIVFNLTGSSNEFRSGVKIDGINVSGLDMTKAKALVTEALNKKYGKSSFSLIDGEKSYSFAIDEISYRFLIDEALTKAYYQGRTGNILSKTYDSLILVFNSTNIQINNTFDEKKLKKLLEKIKKETDHEPQSASIAYKDGNIEILQDTIGRSMDIDMNKELVENQLEKRNFNDIPLQVENVEAEITYAQLREIDTVVSEFHTVFSLSDQNRSHNIKLACSKLDGMILKPGESFSMNEALGPRTAKNGYKEAPVIFKNELVPGTGGGICQVTTTLYNSVLKAKLGVLERSPHSRPLGYVSPGQDATIAEGSIDFKFRNDRDYAVCIAAFVKGNTIKIQILGKSEPEKKTIKLRSVVVESIPPGEDEIEIDDTLPDGERVVVKKPRNGVRAVLYRETFSENNVLLDSEVISKDYYRPEKGLVKINSNYMVFLTVEGYVNE